MPKEPQSRPSGPRQRPVSCKFCRTRKLRCSRDAPCSNCVSRKIQCDLEHQNNNAGAADESEKAELLKRIRKLEAIVERSAANNVPTPTLTPAATSALSTNNVASPFDGTAKRFRSHDIPVPMQQLDQYFAWLESIYDGSQEESDSIPSTKVGFCICSFQLTTEVQQYVAATSSSDPSIMFCLPEYTEAKVLLDKFTRDIEDLHHVVLPRTLPVLLQRVYSSLASQSSIKSGEILLVLSIFAAAMHAWTDKDCQSLGLFTNRADPQKRSARWVKATEDLLDIALRTTRISVEGISAIVIITFVVASYKGFSRRCWFLFNNALCLARDLGLHCIDHPSNAAHANTAESEIGRRVWWYLVSSDWAMATNYHGLAQGTYTCHKRHMATKKPLNLDDEDVFDGMHLVGKPVSQPTDMTYFVLRNELNDTLRSIIDRAPLLSGGNQETSYEAILDIDTELQQMQDNIPPFFHMAPSEVVQQYNFSEEKAKKISRQGKNFRTIFYAARCKLHLPYARRGFTESDFARSRDICVRSARLIIQTESESHKAGLEEGTGHYKLLHYSITLFVACTVLLMEYCQLKLSGSREGPRKEICFAVDLLDAASSENDVTCKFLDSLIMVLLKNGITPSKALQKRMPVTLCDGASPPSSATNAFPVTPLSVASQPTSAESSDAMGIADFHNMENGPQLNDLVRSIDGIDVGMIEWDDIFMGLGDSAFM